MSEIHTVRVQMKKLEKLQEIDLSVDRLKKEIAELPGIYQTLALKLEAIQKKRALKTTESAESKKRTLQAQAGLDLTQDRLQRAAAKLDAAKKSGEYNAAVKEMDQLKKQKETLALETAKGAEEQKTIETQSEELRLQEEAILAEIEQKKSEASGAAERLEASLNEILAVRREASLGIERSTLSMYDRVRGAKQGLGMVPLISGRCKACNILTSPQMSQMIQKAEAFHQCPNCHRYLYHPDAVQTITV